MARRRAILGAVLIAVLFGASACSPLGHRFAIELVFPDGSHDIDVVLYDQTGHVAGIDPGAADEGSGDVVPVVTPAQDKSGFMVGWLGGECTDRVELTLRKTDAGYTLNMRGIRPLIISCTAIGIPRSVFVRWSGLFDGGEISTSGQEE